MREIYETLRRLVLSALDGADFFGRRGRRSEDEGYPAASDLAHADARGGAWQRSSAAALRMRERVLRLYSSYAAESAGTAAGAWYSHAPSHDPAWTAENTAHRVTSFSEALASALNAETGGQPGPLLGALKKVIKEALREVLDTVRAETADERARQAADTLEHLVLENMADPGRPEEPVVAWVQR